MRRSEIARYRRQVTLLGQDRQQKLLDARVAVIGAGGLGSPALLYLAGAGVGRVLIIDADEVDLSNLHRQIIHTTAGVGRPKTDSAREAMLELNPSISVTVVRERLSWENAGELLTGHDMVLDGSDNFETRHIASRAAASLGIPHIWASILGFDAQLSVFWAGHGPIYEDLFPAPPPPGSVPSCSQSGVLGPVVGVVGSAMAVEAVKLITGIGTPLLGTLGYYCSLEGTWEYIPVRADPRTVPRVLAHVGASSSSTELLDVPRVPSPPPGTALIDVREATEFNAYSIPGAVNVPLSAIRAGEIPTEVETGSEVVFYCASGVRSAQAVAILHAAGFSSMSSLDGGIEGWLDATGA
ncbi:ThiF family adenylyltransferase [Corynebacterium pacaense]|uniref:ThiF family adenylyltransferase n=1 Tax=Corynebacterium pacaense TaxID=1816684 RepID=UPI0009BA6A37|nr:ThiF family adenylyltransferase [Corynebacterium pacaense]